MSNYRIMRVRNAEGNTVAYLPQVHVSTDYSNRWEDLSKPCSLRDAEIAVDTHNGFVDRLTPVVG